MTLLYYSLVLLAVFSFAFTVWRRLHEDYPDKPVFYLTILVLFFGLAGQYLAGIWGFLVGAVAALWWVSLHFKIRFFEAADALASASLWLWTLLAAAGLARAGAGELLPKFVLVAIGALSLILHYFFLARYRGFSWYISGRVGFAGLGALSVYFFLRLLAFFLFWMLSSNVYAFDGLLAGAAATVLVAVIWLRSGRVNPARILKTLSRRHRGR